MAVTVSIPVDLRSPDVSVNPGNAWWTVTQIGSNKDVGHWEMIKDDDSGIYGEVRIPPNMAATPNVYFEAWVSHTGATTGEVTRLRVDYLARQTAESLTTALTTTTAVDFTVSNTADVIEKVRLPASGSITAPVAGDVLIVQLFHNGDSAAGGSADTLTQNTRVHRLDMFIDLA